MSAVIESRVSARDMKKSRVFSVDFRWIILTLVMLSAVYISYRTYQQNFAMSMGLDSTTPEFDTYWSRLMRIQLPVLFGLGGSCWLYLILTRDKNIEKLPPSLN